MKLYGIDGFLTKIKRIFLRCAPMAMLAMLPIMNSCEKPDDPTPPTPAPEPTPVVPTKEIKIDFNWNDKWSNNNLDTIAYYANQEDVKFVFMNLVKDIYSEVWPTYKFHTARDSLQKRFDISDKVRGSGTIIVNRQCGAQLPSVTTGTGMALEDSIWFTSKGFQIKRYDPYGNRK